MPGKRRAARSSFSNRQDCSGCRKLAHCVSRGALREIARFKIRKQPSSWSRLLKCAKSAPGVRRAKAALSSG